MDLGEWKIGPTSALRAGTVDEKKAALVARRKLAVAADLGNLETSHSYPPPRPML